MIPIPRHPDDDSPLGDSGGASSLHGVDDQVHVQVRTLAGKVIPVRFQEQNLRKVDEFGGKGALICQTLGPR
jgi:hypothetical protein